MKRAMLIGCLVAVVVSPASANFLTNGDFSAGLTGWNTWIERDAGDYAATVTSGVLNESGSNYNGGVWQLVNVPVGVPLTIDGEWASNPTAANQQWGEVIVIEGNNPPTNGVDTTGPLVYKNDTFATPNGWAGVISATSPVANNPGAGPLGAGSTTGQVVVVLKSGNTSGPFTGVDFDNMTLTPEPATLALFAIPALAMFRRRRRA